MATAKIIISWSRKGNKYNTVQTISVEDVLTGLTVSAPAKTVYTEGESLDLTGMRVHAEYASGITADVTGLCTFTPEAGTVLSGTGRRNVQAIYTEDGVTKTAETTIEVNDGPFVIPDNAWNTATDEEIAQMLTMHDAGEIDIYDYIKVGDVRTVSLAAIASVDGLESHVAQSVDFVVADKNVVELASGGKCHFVLQQKNCLLNTGYMNAEASNAGGWNVSARRAWCNSAYLGALPESLQAIIKQVKIKSYSGGQSDALQLTQDSIFLPCCFNVVGKNTWNDYSTANAEDNVRWEYYLTESNQVKRAGASGGYRGWWTRTPDFSTYDLYQNHRFTTFSGRSGAVGGGTANANTDTVGIAPCFCI